MPNPIMLRSIPLGFALAVMLLAATIGRAQAIADLTIEEFQKLHREMQPPDEAWRDLPWHTSLLEARAQAAKEKKPVYMLVRSGHPLGCV